MQSIAEGAGAPVEVYYKFFFFDSTISIRGAPPSEEFELTASTQQAQVEAHFEAAQLPNNALTR